MLFNLNFAQTNKVEYVDEKIIKLVSIVRNKLGGKTLMVDIGITCHVCFDKKSFIKYVTIGNENLIHEKLLSVQNFKPQENGVQDNT